VLTNVTIRNFKRFDEVVVELGNPVVFIGPNNSGKTTALQALALWDLGLRRLQERQRIDPGMDEADEGVRTATINRRDLIGLPVPDAGMLWKNNRWRKQGQEKGELRGSNRLNIEIVVAGVSQGRAWEYGLGFCYANEESFYCFPLRPPQGEENPPIPLDATARRIAFLPPMSGLAANEPRLEPGRLNVLLGEGRTAEVLRNLCYYIATSAEGEESWRSLKTRISSLFRIDLDDPLHVPERGEITMTYRDPSGIHLDISASGRGLQQTLLLLAHLTLNPRSVLLIDEPDAHLEILRQRQIYQVLSATAREHGSQVILASHSEVILNEAADRDVVVAFVGRPHRIDDRGSQLLKSLKEIGFDQYYQAEQTGWVLYLEGSTDLAILQALARVLDHPAQAALERPFVHYVENQPGKARDHFYGLREAKSDLQGFALFDRLDRVLDPNPHLVQWMWRRREIENYLCSRETLMHWARDEAEGQMGALFRDLWQSQMETSIQKVEQAMSVLGKGSPWEPSTKVSDDFLDPLFQDFFKSLSLPNLMRKTDYHALAPSVPREFIDPEVRAVLDKIAAVCEQAHPSPLP
jgi:AAA domain, putative AbiEii toxin, Type IV TA system/AAA ATPase domain